MTTYSRYVKKSSASWAAGTEASPITEDAYRVEDLSYNTETSNTVQTNTFVGEYQGAPPRPAGRYGLVALTAELRGSQTNVPPYEGALLRACGFKEAIHAFPVTDPTHDTCYQYSLGDLHLNTMTPAGIVDPIDITVNMDREQSAVLSCVGNAQLRLEANQIPKIALNFRGLVDDSVATSTTAGFEEANVPDITIGSIPVPVQDSDFFLRDHAATVVDISVTDYEMTPADIITVATDMTATFTPFTYIKVSGGANAGYYTVIYSEYNSGTGTDIYVYEDLTATLVGTDAITEVYHAYSELVVLRYNIDLGNVTDERSDMNGTFGFSQPLITSRNPTADCQIECTALSEFNPYNKYIINSSFDIVCHINNGAGDNDEITIFQTVKMSAYPSKTDVNGKFVYDLQFMQDIGSGVYPLTLLWGHALNPFSA